MEIGTKYDAGKRRMSLMPRGVINNLLDVLEFGAKKYGDFNWRKGFPWSRLFDATHRHLEAWFDGEDIDPESGLSHLAHATCNLAFLTEFIETRPELDDRPKQKPKEINNDI